jgi:transposase
VALYLGSPQFRICSGVSFRYLRKLLVHGARSAVLRVKRERPPFGPWLDAVERRSPIKVVVNAASNKLARIAWAVLASGEDYRPATVSVAP